MPMKNPPHPGDLINTEIIQALGLNVSKAAEILKVRRATLSDLLHGKAALTPEMALRIEKAFGPDMDHLLRMPWRKRGSTRGRSRSSGTSRPEDGAGNPRHDHEYRCFESHPLPAGMSLIAGVIDSTTNYVEHPEVVADRIERVARVVGDPHRIMAGTDCGFETTSGMGHVAEELVWEKLRALRDGADLASKRLF